MAPVWEGLSGDGMTYRIRCKRHARTNAMRRRTAKAARSILSEFTEALSRHLVYGSFEKPSDGFTPNDNWRPRWMAGSLDGLNRESPMIAMLKRLVA